MLKISDDLARAKNDPRTGPVRLSPFAWHLPAELTHRTRAAIFLFIAELKKDRESLQQFDGH